MLSLFARRNAFAKVLKARARWFVVAARSQCKCLAKAPHRLSTFPTIPRDQKLIRGCPLEQMTRLAAPPTHGSSIANAASLEGTGLCESPSPSSASASPVVFSTAGHGLPPGPCSEVPCSFYLITIESPKCRCAFNPCGSLQKLRGPGMDPK